MPRESLPIDADLLATLVAPRTHEPLRIGTAAELRAAQKVGAELPPFQAVLVTADGARAWPIIDGIPDLLADHALILR